MHGLVIPLIATAFVSAISKVATIWVTALLLAVSIGFYMLDLSAATPFRYAKNDFLVITIAVSSVWLVNCLCRESEVHMLG